MLTRPPEFARGTWSATVRRSQWFSAWQNSTAHLGPSWTRQWTAQARRGQVPRPSFSHYSLMCEFSDIPEDWDGVLSATWGDFWALNKFRSFPSATRTLFQKMSRKANTAASPEVNGINWSGPPYRSARLGNVIWLLGGAGLVRITPLGWSVQQQRT